MAGFHLDKSLVHAHADTLIEELEAAVEHATETTEATWMKPVGKAAQVSTPSEIKARI